MAIELLPASFYARDAVTVARALLGTVARPSGDGWPLDAGQIRVGPRVGITKAAERP